MRKDQQGFFWEDEERVSVWANKHNNKGGRTNVLPPIPETGWVLPKEFPNLSNAPILGIDTETYDPNLTESGPSIRTGGYLVGLSVSTPDKAWYFPMRHKIGENLPPDKVIAWAKDTFALQMPKVFHNAMYDLEWLGSEGIEVNGRIHDTSFAEPLLDEDSFRGYSLEAVGRKWVGEGKDDKEMYEWLSRAYGGPATRKSQAKNIYRCPTALVGPYAEQDAMLPIQVLREQLKELEAQGLMELYELECKLIAPLLFMRQRGVPVDVRGAEQAFDFLTAEIKKAEKILGGINVYAAEEISYFCEANGIEYPLTEKGNPSFTSEWLLHHSDPRMQAISDVRRNMKARDTFVKGYILDKHIDGRLYCQFHPLKGDENGTVSGRFSSAMPNLQNIPARDEIIGPMIRSLFIPEQGCRWLRYDWSQIEYRLLVHYAMGEGSDDARIRYKEHPETDFHAMTQEIVWPGRPEMRKPAKNINFGLVYGMSERTLAGHINKPLVEAQEMFATYHGEVPFVKHTYDFVSNRAAQRGYIKTILGRRRRFNMWESTVWEEKGVFPEDVAREKFKRVRRAFTHKALNSLLQGGSADLMKKALVMIWEEGLIDDDFILYLLVHDEFDFNFPDGFEERVKRVHEIMEHCLSLNVPIIAEVEAGANWGMLQSYAL